MIGYIPLMVRVGLALAMFLLDRKRKRDDYTPDSPEAKGGAKDPHDTFWDT